MASFIPTWTVLIFFGTRLSCWATLIWVSCFYDEELITNGHWIEESFQKQTFIEVHALPGSTISTLLHDKINPKDCQVLSLGDSGFVQFFRVVSSVYGKPRNYSFYQHSPVGKWSDWKLWGCHFFIRQEEGVAEKTPACPDPERPADAEVWWFGCAILEGERNSNVKSMQAGGFSLLKPLWAWDISPPVPGFRGRGALRADGKKVCSSQPKDHNEDGFLYGIKCWFSRGQETEEFPEMVWWIFLPPRKTYMFRYPFTWACFSPICSALRVNWKSLTVEQQQFFSKTIGSRQQKSFSKMSVDRSQF